VPGSDLQHLVVLLGGLGEGARFEQPAAKAVGGLHVVLPLLAFDGTVEFRLDSEDTLLRHTDKP
jgi:hypothetical protein